MYTSHFLQGTRKTLTFLTSHLVVYTHCYKSGLGYKLRDRDKDREKKKRKKKRNKREKKKREKKTERKKERDR